ncbi:MAG: hypothetical protein K940chlam3_00766 [Chlamydiae bacterium]|nr:hypothetical protein [Chlamydiota bacterium]
MQVQSSSPTIKSDDSTSESEETKKTPEEEKADKLYEQSVKNKKRAKKACICSSIVGVICLCCPCITACCVAILSGDNEGPDCNGLDDLCFCDDLSDDCFPCFDD